MSSSRKRGGEPIGSLFDHLVEEELAQPSHPPRPERMNTSMKLAIGTKETIGKLCLDKGLGLRGKSAWINAAIKEYLAQPNWLAMTMQLAQSAMPGATEPVSLDANVYLDLWAAAVALSKALWNDEDHPEITSPDISLVTRAAIAWKLAMEDAA